MSREIIILNSYLNTLGGGELSTFYFYQAFRDLGFKPTIVTLETNQLDLTNVQKLFDLGSTHLDIRYCRSYGEIHKLATQSAGFLNHQFNSFFSTKAPWNGLAVMFPSIKYVDTQGSCNNPKLNKFNALYCNSHFTAGYVNHFWGKKLNPKVIHPPVYQQLTPGHDAKKTNMILNIGRFNVKGHHKNQGFILDTFKKLVDGALIPPDTALHLAGVINWENADNILFTKQLKTEATGYNVHFHFDASRKVLQQLLHQAKIYFHSTGYSPDEPVPAYCCEHFGIAIVEGMLNKAVPVIFGRGGALDFVRFGQTGYTYHDQQEAINSIALLFSHNQLMHKLSHAAFEKAQAFSYSNFKHQLQETLCSTGLLRQVAG